MNFYINQTITINNLRIQGITNSSVFQIGSAGIIKPLSILYNTGGFTKPAPELQYPYFGQLPPNFPIMPEIPQRERETEPRVPIYVPLQPSR